MLWQCAVLACVAVVLSQAQQRDEEHTGVVSDGSAWERLLKAPSVGIVGGLGRLGREGLQQQLQSPGVVDLQLGMAELTPMRRIPALVEYARWFVAIEMGSSALGLGSERDALPQRWWRFGLVQERGYGYRLGDRSSLLLTHGGGAYWTVLELPGAVPQELGSFHRRLRFGAGRGGAVVLQFSPLMGAGISFERAVVFPAHLVWKHLGSSALENVGHLLIGEFVRRILQARTPAAAPIVSFVLHNGFAIGWYELLRGRMNWPFASAAPLRSDVVRLHLQWLF